MSKKIVNNFIMHKNQDLKNPVLYGCHGGGASTT